MGCDQTLASPYEIQPLELLDPAQGNPIRPPQQEISEPNRPTITPRSSKIQKRTSKEKKVREGKRTSPRSADRTELTGKGKRRPRRGYCYRARVQAVAASSRGAGEEGKPAGDRTEAHLFYKAKRPLSTVFRRDGSDEWVPRTLLWRLLYTAPPGSPSGSFDSCIRGSARGS